MGVCIIYHKFAQNVYFVVYTWLCCGCPSLSGLDASTMPILANFKIKHTSLKWLRRYMQTTYDDVFETIRHHWFIAQQSRMCFLHLFLIVCFRTCYLLRQFFLNLYRLVFFNIYNTTFRPIIYNTRNVVHRPCIKILIFRHYCIIIIIIIIAKILFNTLYVKCH